MKTYSHSGAVPPLGAIAALIVSLAAAMVCGILYAYAFAYIPHIVLNIAVTLVFAGALGFVVSQAAERAKLRNNIFVGCLAAMTALFGLYVYWGAYIWALVGFQNAAKIGLHAFYPPVIFEFGQHFFNKGTWSFTEDHPVTGWFLASLWILEAVVVVGLTVIVSQWNAEQPFCEACRCWTQTQRGVARLLATGGEPEWTDVLGGDLPALAAFSPAPPGSYLYVRLDLARCPQCEHTRLLTISQVSLRTDDKGKTTEVTRALVTNAILTPDQAAVVETCGQLYRANLEVEIEEPNSAEAGGSAPESEEGTSS